MCSSIPLENNFSHNDLFPEGVVKAGVADLPVLTFFDQSLRQYCNSCKAPYSGRGLCKLCRAHAALRKRLKQMSVNWAKKGRKLVEMSEELGNLDAQIAERQIAERVTAQ